MRYLWAVLICAAAVAGCGKQEDAGPGETPGQAEPVQSPAELRSSTPAPEASDLSKILTENEIKQFVAVFPKLLSQAQKTGEKLKAATARDRASGVQEWMLAHTTASEAQKTLQQHGLTPEAFGSVVARVSQAYMAAEQQKGVGRMEADMAAQKERLNDPNVSEQEKAQIRASLAGAATIKAAMQQHLTAPAENIAIVRKHWAELKPLFEQLD